MTVASHLAAPRAQVWSEVATMAGVNDELAPWVRMTFPADRTQLDDRPVVAGEVVLRSTLLAGGVVPFDRHRLAFESVTPGVGFVEESTSLLQRRWRHERTLSDAEDGGCVVVDRIVARPRLALAAPLVRRLVAATFRHRHRRLQARHGGRRAQDRAA